MQTSFTAEQLADPHMRESEKILRTCVHCGFCTATCPTYLLLGDELDSPARAHLPHQGHAGERQAGDGRGRQAYRPLPVVPVLHDDLPVGRALHASRRSCARAHREDLRARRGGPFHARRAGERAALSLALSRRARRRVVRAAAARGFRRVARDRSTPARHVGADADAVRRASPATRARACERHAARRDADRLRPAGAAALHQRGGAARADARTASR